MSAIPDDPAFDVIFGVIGLGLVVASIVTGWTVLPRTGAIRRDKAPRAFWIINALIAILAVSLIYHGPCAG